MKIKNNYVDSQKIKYNYVYDVELTIENLIKELIKNNISYVFIKPNEIHCNDKIIRFYEKGIKLKKNKQTRQEYRDTLIKLFLNMEKESLKSLVTLENKQFPKKDNYHKFNNYYQRQNRVSTLRKHY